MRQIVTNKGNKRLRCIKSIEAAKVGIAQRDAFGRQCASQTRPMAFSGYAIAIAGIKPVALIGPDRVDLCSVCVTI